MIPVLTLWALRPGLDWVGNAPDATRTTGLPVTSDHDRWREDGRLANEITKVNHPLGRYALRISDSMLGDASQEPSPQDEHDLGTRLHSIGDRIIRRAARRQLAIDSAPAPQVIDGAVDAAPLDELH